MLRVEGGWPKEIDYTEARVMLHHAILYYMRLYYIISCSIMLY